jgi:hypothetical protein
VEGTAVASEIFYLLKTAGEFIAVSAFIIFIGLVAALPEMPV